MAQYLYDQAIVLGEEEAVRFLDNIGLKVNKNVIPWQPTQELIASKLAS